MLELYSFIHKISVGETVSGAWSSPIVHIGRFFRIGTINNYVLIIFSVPQACHAHGNVAVM